MDTKYWPQDVQDACKQGLQKCHICNLIECGDNLWIRYTLLDKSCPYVKGTYLFHKGKNYYIQEVYVESLADMLWAWKLTTLLQLKS